MLATGLSHSCAVYSWWNKPQFKKYNRMVCWGGNNEYGETVIDEDINDEGVEMMAVGDAHTC